MGKSNVSGEYQEKLREDAEVSKVVGVNLRRLRKATKTPEGKKITFDRLAKLTALNRLSIWRFECGRSGMTVATLVRLREALDCSWDDLLGGCESKIVKERKKFSGEIVRGK